LPKVLRSTNQAPARYPTVDEVMPASALRSPDSRPRSSSGITLASRKLNTTPCMPMKNPNSARKTHTATRFWPLPRKKPARPMPSTCSRTSDPTRSATGRTRRRCSITVTEKSGERH